MQSKRVVAVLTVCILSVIVFSGTPEVTAVLPPPSDLNNGPYVDNVEYTVMMNQDERILALQAGNIEMDLSIFDSENYDTLNADPDIDIFSALRYGYGHITINCRDAPLNESVLRRAFAYAYNKTEVTENIFDGFSIEHDSLVPRPNSWCVEDDFSNQYYTNQAAIGNALLDASGLFPIDGGTGFRTYKGAAFDIDIEYASSSPDIGAGVAQIGVDALTELHIDAAAVPADFNDYISRLDSHGDYDMVFYAVDIGNEIDWLAYEYWSDFADVSYQNPSNFANASYDVWRDQLLYGTTYEDVYEAAAAMQEILQYNVPRLVVYENVYSQAYRNNQFIGHVEDLGSYISGQWTMRKIHKLDGTQGGSVTVAIKDELFNFNFFTTVNPSSYAIFSNIYSSLYKYGPDMQPRADLAESMLVETHSDNTMVPSGHSRYTIDIVQNATWTDGIPLTAADVAFSFNYYEASVAYGNPYGAHHDNLVLSHAPSPYRVVLEFDIESYLIFSEIAFDYIIPEHIFNDDTGIGYSGWSSWSAPHATSGPFYVSDYDYRDWYKITKNPDYYYPAPNPAPVVSAIDDISYVVGTTGNEIVWEVSDDDPLTFVVMKDLEVLPISTGFWNGSDIVVNIDGLPVGTYNYTLALMDFSANLVMDSVTVNVVSATPLELDNLMILISVGSVGVIIVIAVLVWKTKQS